MFAHEGLHYLHRTGILSDEEIIAIAKEAEIVNPGLVDKVREQEAEEDFYSELSAYYLDSLIEENENAFISGSIPFNLKEAEDAYKKYLVNLYKDYYGNQVHTGRRKGIGTENQESGREQSEMEEGGEGNGTHTSEALRPVRESGGLRPGSEGGVSNESEMDTELGENGKTEKVNPERPLPGETFSDYTARISKQRQESAAKTDISSAEAEVDTFASV